MGDEGIAERSRGCNDNAVKRITNARIAGRPEKNVRGIILEKKRTGLLLIACNQLGKWEWQTNSTVLTETENFF